MKKLFCLLLLLSATQAQAELLPALPGQGKPSPHKFFVTSQTPPSETFDTWQFDGGYAYSVFDSVDLYVGARIHNSYQDNELGNGFLSGVSYTFNDKLSVKSTLHSRSELQENGERENIYSAEVSSRLKLSEHLDLHATLDYEEWQQGVEVGLGFSF
jgi:long-subunit fatty acid transport protein